jgi:pimeloyl-ACP methyl ester carboxylesterase
LVLTATRAAPDTPEGKRARDAAAQQVEKAGINSLAEGMAAKLLSPRTVATRPELVDRVRTMIAGTSNAGAIHALMGMKLRPDSTTLLGKISIPTLVIHGAEDQVVPPDEAAAMADAIPQARFEIIQNAGHLLNMEQSEHFNRLLSGFLYELPATKG